MARSRRIRVRRRTGIRSLLHRKSQDRRGTTIILNNPDRTTKRENPKTPVSGRAGEAAVPEKTPDTRSFQGSTLEIENPRN